MIHLSIDFVDTAAFAAFLRDPLNYSAAPSVGETPTQAEIDAGPHGGIGNIPVDYAVGATNTTFRPLTPTGLAEVTESKKRGPGRPRKTPDAQPEVASNTGSTSPEPTGDPSGSDGAVEPAAAAPVAVAAGADVPTIDSVRSALSDVNTALGMAAARQLLTDHGATRISEVKVETYPAFIEAAKALVASAPKKEAA